MAEWSDGAEEAEIAGEIVWGGDEDECLQIGPGDAGLGEPVGAVWLHGTTWDASDAEVVLPNRRALSVGEQFVLGGGVHSIDDDPAEPGSGWGLTQEVLDAAQACGWTEFAYVQSD